MKVISFLFIFLIFAENEILKAQLVASPGIECSRPVTHVCASGPYFGQPSPGSVPKRFAPLFIPAGAWGITFSPDGLECFISLTVNDNAVLLTSKESAGTWSSLDTAEFSGIYWDMEPHITPDGSRMYFGSKRPLTGYPSGILYQWYVDKTDSGWSEPKPMEPPLLGRFMMFPSVANNKNMYFTGGDGQTTCNIMVSKFVSGSYQEPEILSDSINYLYWAAHPFIAPDESYLIFDACTDQINHIYELFISFRKTNGTWTKAKKLPASINPGGCPYVSPDGKNFFFWKSTCTMWVDAGFIDKMRPLSGAYLGQEPPDTVPVRFGPVSLQSTTTWFWHGSPSFSPDLTEMFFVKYLVSSDKTEINYMKMEDGFWSEPVKPSFASGDYIDNNPLFSPSGDTVFFYSQRPGGPYFYVVRAAGDWSEPVPLHIPYPESLSTSWQFFIARDGTFYFDLWQETGDIDIYKSEKITGQYVEAVRFGPEINTPYQEWGACLDPDEKVMIFPSNKPGGNGLHDLYRVTKNPDGSWDSAVNLGNNINGSNEDGFPSLTPDGKYFFFTTARNGDLGYNPYWVKATTVAPVLGNEEFNRISNDITALLNFPNPCSEMTTISFTSPAEDQAKIVLTDLFGKIITTVFDGMTTKGINKILVDLSSIKPGIYFYTLQIRNNYFTKKIVVI